MAKLSKNDALRRLHKIRKELSKLQASTDPFGYMVAANEIPPAFEKWCRTAKVCIAKVFPDNPDYIDDFEEIFHEKYNLYEISRSQPYMLQQNYEKALISADTFFESMMEEVEDDWDDSPQSSRTDTRTGEHPRSNEVFIIHGRDEGIKNEVARLLTQVGLEPIILAEQPSQGSTIIEKFEQHADVGFAVALLTPDDLGSERDGKELKSRARQNVIFELGFFIGKLGRKRVCALTKGHIEIPSDYSGVVYIGLEQAPAWKYELVRELRKAGLDADANKIQ